MKIYLPVLFVGLCISSSVSAQPNEGNQPKWINDAKIIAEQDGISVGEAIQRYKAETRMNELMADLEKEGGDGFAGAYIERKGPIHRVVVKKTKGNQDKVKSRKARFSDVNSVEEQVISNYSFSFLQEQRAIIDEKLALGDVDYSISIDVIGNKLELSGPNTDDLRNALETVPDYVRIVKGPGRPDIAQSTNIYGGLRIDDNVNRPCTTSFTVENASATRGIATAGHCNSGTSYSIGGKAATAMGSNYSGNIDARWFRVVGELHVSQANLGPTAGIRPVTSLTPLSSQGVGSTVCFYGHKTNKSFCGQIQRKDHYWQDSAGTTGGIGPFVSVKVSGQTVICQGGDSGGPVMITYGAAGMVTNCSSNAGGDMMYYMPAERINSGLGVKITTSG